MKLSWTAATWVYAALCIMCVSVLLLPHGQEHAQEISMNSKNWTMLNFCYCILHSLCVSTRVCTCTLCITDEMAWSDMLFIVQSMYLVKKKTKTLHAWYIHTTRKEQQKPHIKRSRGSSREVLFQRREGGVLILKTLPTFDPYKQVWQLLSSTAKR